MTEEAQPTTEDAEARAAQPESKPRWRALLSVPGVLAMAALAAIASYIGTEVASSVKTRAFQGDPVAIVVEPNPGQTSAFGDLPIFGLVPTSALADGGTSDCRRFRPWVLKHGGVDAPESKLQLVVQGLADEPILIAGMRAEVLRAAEPMNGARVTCPPAAAAQMRAVAIDLDSPGRRGQYSRREFGFTIARGETETFNIVATARKRQYEWRLLLDLVIAGERRTIRVPDDGTTYRTSAARGRAWAWSGTEWRR